MAPIYRNKSPKSKGFTVEVLFCQSEGDTTPAHSGSPHSDRGPVVAHLRETLGDDWDYFTAELLAGANWACP